MVRARQYFVSSVPSRNSRRIAPRWNTSPTSSEASSPARMPVAYCRNNRARSRTSVWVPAMHFSTRVISSALSTFAWPPPPYGRPGLLSCRGVAVRFMERLLSRAELYNQIYYKLLLGVRLVGAELAAPDVGNPCAFRRDRLNSVFYWVGAELGAMGGGVPGEGRALTEGNSPYSALELKNSVPIRGGYPRAVPADAAGAGFSDRGNCF